MPCCRRVFNPMLYLTPHSRDQRVKIIFSEQCRNDMLHIKLKEITNAAKW